MRFYGLVEILIECSGNLINDVALLLLKNCVNENEVL